MHGERKENMYSETVSNHSFDKQNRQSQRDKSSFVQLNGVNKSTDRLIQVI